MSIYESKQVDNSTLSVNDNDKNSRASTQEFTTGIKGFFLYWKARLKDVE